MCTMRRIEKNIRVIMIAFFAFAFVVSTAGAEVSASYLYDLSSFHGKSPYNWATISVDAGKNEIYVINPTDRAVSISMRMPWRYTALMMTGRLEILLTLR